MLTLLVATVCLQAGPVSVDCHTEVVRVEHSLAECHRMRKPTEAWLTEMAVGGKIVVILTACRYGDLS